MKYKATVNEFLGYLRSPTDTPDNEATVGVKVKTMVHLFLFSLLAIYGYAILMGVFEKFHWIDPGINSNSTLVFKYTYLRMILVGVVAAPILEELIFRLPLRYKYNYILRWTVKIIAGIKRVDEDEYDEKARAIWHKYFKYFFFLIILLFGSAHIFNFANYGKVWNWVIVLVFPQLVVGSILGYLRVKFSLRWSMVYHAFHNFIFFSLAFMHFSTLANCEVRTRDYAFSMHKGSSVHTGADGFQVVPGRVVFDNSKLTDVLEVVLKKPGKYFLNNNLGDLYVSVNFRYKHLPQKPDNSLQIVSYNIQKAMKMKLRRQMIRNVVWELYVSDSVRYRKAVLPLLTKEKHYSLRRIGEFLDRRNKDIYIQSQDSIHQFYVDLNQKWPPFEEIKTSWNQKYGLGFKKVQRDVEFINMK